MPFPKILVRLSLTSKDDFKTSLNFIFKDKPLILL